MEGSTKMSEHKIKQKDQPTDMRLEINENHLNDSLDE